MKQIGETRKGRRRGKLGEPDLMILSGKRTICGQNSGQAEDVMA